MKTIHKLVKYGATLESAVISGADFVIDPTKRTGTINVFFKNGDDYIYEDVPEMIFLGLLHAESHGQYFIKHIKDNYEFAKIN